MSLNLSEIRWLPNARRAVERVVGRFVTRGFVPEYRDPFPRGYTRPGKPVVSVKMTARAGLYRAYTASEGVSELDHSQHVVHDPSGLVVMTMRYPYKTWTPAAQAAIKAILICFDAVAGQAGAGARRWAPPSFDHTALSPDAYVQRAIARREAVGGDAAPPEDPFRYVIGSLSEVMPVQDWAAIDSAQTQLEVACAAGDFGDSLGKPSTRNGPRGALLTAGGFAPFQPMYCIAARAVSATPKMLTEKGAVYFDHDDLVAELPQYPRGKYVEYRVRLNFPHYNAVQAVEKMVGWIDVE